MVFLQLVGVVLGKFFVVLLYRSVFIFKVVGFLRRLGYRFRRQFFGGLMLRYCQYRVIVMTMVVIQLQLLRGFEGGQFLLWEFLDIWRLFILQRIFLIEDFGYYFVQYLQFFQVIGILIIYFFFLVGEIRFRDRVQILVLCRFGVCIFVYVVVLFWGEQGLFGYCVYYSCFFFEGVGFCM